MCVRQARAGLVGFRMRERLLMAGAACRCGRISVLRVVICESEKVRLTSSFSLVAFRTRLLLYSLSSSSGIDGTSRGHGRCMFLRHVLRASSLFVFHCTFRSLLFVWSWD